MPPRGWVNLSVREEVARMLREFMEREGIVSPSDAIRLLLERYALLTRSVVTDRVSKEGGSHHTDRASKGRLSWVVDRVRREKVVLLSELKLRRDPAEAMREVERAGLVVLYGDRDLAIVDDGFWEEFQGRLGQLPRNPALEGPEGKLFTFLKENALIHYDDSNEGWKLS